MNAAIIRGAATEIERCEAALNWLEQYGEGITSTNKECASITVRLNHASACNGAKQAQEMLERFAIFEIEKIVQSAISNCRNTIEIQKQVIERELKE